MGKLKIILISVVAVLFISLLVVLRPQTTSLSTNLSFLSQFTPTLTPIPPTPTPIPVGSLSGKITGGYYSRNISNVTVTATSSLDSKTTTSNSSGVFSFNSLFVGDYQLSFSHNDYQFVNFPVSIQKGVNQIDKAIFGNLKNPQPLRLSGTATPHDAFISLYYQGTLLQNITPDASGNFSLSLTKIGKYHLDPGVYTGYIKPAEIDFVVDGYGGTKVVNLNFKPTVSQVGFKIYVFDDKNENGVQDNGENYVHYQAVQITNTSGNSTRADGNSWRVVVPPEGDVESPVSFANYNFKLVPESESWATYFKITKGEANISISSSTSGTQIITLGAHKLY